MATLNWTSWCAIVESGSLDDIVTINYLQLRRPKFRGITFEKIKNAVETSDKQRFTMLFEPSNAASLVKGNNVSEIPVEIPHSGVITIPPPPGTDIAQSLDDLMNADGIWYIRANQGHTIKASELVGSSCHINSTHRWKNWICIKYKMHPRFQLPFMGPRSKRGIK